MSGIVEATGASPLERLEALRNWERGPRSRMEPTIAPMRDLMGRLGNPHLAFGAIHVTGTKGKGSVCALIESALHEAGMRVGRYASPHVDSICERVSIRRKLVQRESLMHALERVLDVRDQATLAGTAGACATWFDVFTAAAFTVFAGEKLDWVVVEVGLGGRLDSTNVVDGKTCVITNIGLEHTDVLGATEAEIAGEKAGIIKRGSLVVSGVSPDTAADRVIRMRAAEAGATLFAVPPVAGITASNLAIAGATLDALGRLGIAGARSRLAVGAQLLDDNLAKSARLPGRMERWMFAPDGSGARTPLLIDGAHVDIALAAVLEDARGAEWARGPLFCVLAFGKDKQPGRMLPLLRGRARHVLFTGLDGRDCWDPEELVGIAAELGISSSIGRNARAAVDACVRLAKDGGWVLAAGSLHLVAPVRRAAQELGARPAR